MSRKLLGAIEAGGTTFRCALARSPSEILEQTTIETRDPVQTLADCERFLGRGGPLQHLGIASFGPLDLDPRSPTYGHILDTPKLAWHGADLLALAGRLGTRASITTDVVAAALAELSVAGEGVRSLAYVTVGTGIGGGFVIDGAPQGARAHPEMGHLFVPHDRRRDPFGGTCPFHGDCVEGLAAAPALHARWGTDPEHLADDHPAWPLEAHYLGLLGLALWRILAPDRIVLGGGVMQRRGLLELTRDAFESALGGYHVPENARALLCPPRLGRDAGLIGALLLAEKGG